MCFGAGRALPIADYNGNLACSQEFKADEMDYLFVSLFWYLATAFGVGVFVGWYSCSFNEDE